MKFWGIFWLKVEVIFKILEVNFGILVEVICPASKSQGCVYLPGGVYISQGVYISPKGCIYLPRGVYIFQGVYPYISSEGCIISPEILISAHVLFCLSVSLIPKGLNLVMVIGGSEVVLLVPEGRGVYSSLFQYNHTNKKLPFSTVFIKN